MTTYICSISSVNNSNVKGEKSEKIEQKTRITAPMINNFFLGEVYLTGKTIDDANVIHAPIYTLDGSYIANGSAVGGNVKLYLNNNSKIIENSSYLIYVVDGSINQPGSIYSMPSKIEIVPPKITLNPVTTKGMLVSGKSEPGIQVRIYVNAEARTIVNVDENGDYAWNSGVVSIGDVIRVETKIGSVYSSSQEYTVSE